MSYYLIDINKDFDFDKIIISNKIVLDDTTNRYYLYYMDDKPKEICIKIPPVRLLYNYENMKYNQIKLPLFPVWEGTLNFISFMKKLEKKVKKTINSENTFYSCIENYNDLKQIKLFLSKNLKITSTLKDLQFSNFKQQSEIEFIIKIPYVYEKNDSIELTISGYQVKYTPSIDNLDIDFWDDEPKSKKIIDNDYTSSIKNTSNIPEQITPFTPIIKNNQYNQNNNKNNNNKPQPKISIIPSKQDLLNAISKLKKIN